MYLIWDIWSYSSRVVQEGCEIKPQKEEVVHRAVDLGVSSLRRLQKLDKREKNEKSKGELNKELGELQNQESGHLLQILILTELLKMKYKWCLIWRLDLDINTKDQRTFWLSFMFRKNRIFLWWNMCELPQ